ncbi:hypothetical protein [Methylobacterium oryzisoli]|uniref:hypothetical protein n=1 Tax=Methylobacterium oryzisoli TaxID=3385502 RepID=UPI003891FE1B
MLVDLVHYLTLPAPLAHRRFGYVRDSVWLRSRARRCRAAWAPHLAAARAVVRAAIATTPGRDTAVVLGSGLLADVPLADLAASFRRVVLVDAVHPWTARLQARRFANVTLLTSDLSGALPLLRGRADDIVPALPPVCAASGTDLVVSANLLSQLPILPVERLPDRSPWSAETLGRRIVAHHLDALVGLRARVCLITDVEAIEEDRAGRVIERSDLLYGVDPGIPDHAWLWDLAPLGEVGYDRRIRHRVLGFPRWPR